jgi:hypothetical protein
MVRRNLPRATSYLLELAGTTSWDGDQVETSAVLTVTPTRWQTPPEWMNFHYLVRCKTVPSHATYSFPSPVGRCLGALPLLIAAPTPNFWYKFFNTSLIWYFHSHWEDFVVLCRQTYLECLSRLVVN